MVHTQGRHGTQEKKKKKMTALGPVRPPPKYTVWTPKFNNRTTMVHYYRQVRTASGSKHPVNTVDTWGYTKGDAEQRHTPARFSAQKTTRSITNRFGTKEKRKKKKRAKPRDTKPTRTNRRTGKKPPKVTNPPPPPPSPLKDGPPPKKTPLSTHKKSTRPMLKIFHHNISRPKHPRLVSSSWTPRPPLPQKPSPSRRARRGHRTSHRRCCPPPFPRSFQTSPVYTKAVLSTSVLNIRRVLTDQGDPSEEEGYARGGIQLVPII